MRVLVVEDDDRIAETLTTSLGRAGFGVERERDGEVAWYRGDTEAMTPSCSTLDFPRWMA